MPLSGITAFSSGRVTARALTKVSMLEPSLARSDEAAFPMPGSALIGEVSGFFSALRASDCLPLRRERK